MSKKAFGKNAFGLDDEEVAEAAPLAINQSYASQYDSIKRKKELQQLSEKYGDVAAYSGEEDEESSEGSSEDSDAVFLTEDKEEDFANVLYMIRSKDPRINEKSQQFYRQSAEPVEKAEKEKKYTLKDEFHRLAANGQAVDEEVAKMDQTVAHKRGEQKVVAKTAEEKKAKASFLAALEGGEDLSIAKKASDSGEENATKKGKKPSKKVVEVLSKAFDVKGTDDADEQFLKNFFTLEKWRDDGATPHEQTWEELAADEQDEIFFDEAEQWERDFQDQKYRHEEENAGEVKTYSRSKEGLLRADDETRKKARERKEMRKKEESDKHAAELRRLKTLKRQEIEDQQSKIERIAGLARGKGKFSKIDLNKEFDPEEFDKMMAEMFDDEYYEAGGDEAELGAMEEELEEAADLELGSDEEGEEAEEAEYTHVPTAKGMYTEDESFLYPAHELATASAVAKPKITPKQALDSEQANLDKRIDEYWRLHYHSIAGDVRTRYKYRTVNAEHFGLSDADVLMEDDRTLNMVTPLNCYASYLTESENKIDRFKSIHRMNNTRRIDADLVSRKYKNKTVVFDPEDATGEEIARKAKAARARLDSQLEKDTSATKGAPTQGHSAKPAKHQQQQQQPPRQQQQQQQAKPKKQGAAPARGTDGNAVKPKQQQQGGGGGKRERPSTSAGGAKHRKTE